MEISSSFEKLPYVSLVSIVTVYRHLHLLGIFVMECTLTSTYCFHLMNLTKVRTPLGAKLNLTYGIIRKVGCISRCWSME